MTRELQQWKAAGSFVLTADPSVKIFVHECGNREASSEETLLLLHGFPESSYSYHAVIPALLNRFKRVIAFDMIGYGFSDKPEDYSYSLLKQADYALEIWEALGITGGHLLAHDMGDSVATELLSRSEERSLPAWFKDGFESITFTNGGMVLEHAQLRIAQKILLSGIGKYFAQLVSFSIFKHQVKSAHGNSNLSNKEIELLWEFGCLAEGNKKTYLTIRYLNDRKRYEKSRWLPALAQTKIPIHICWGKDDAVAPIKIAMHLKDQVCPQAKLTLMDNVGHFGQLGNPEAWVEGVLGFFGK
ncbi:alpha/beta hydrolase [Chitinophagales bacterium]|nr:alpha/beta hydrolase [Chitinophagales bacterium]